VFISPKYKLKLTISGFYVNAYIAYFFFHRLIPFHLQKMRTTEPMTFLYHFIIKLEELKASNEELNLRFTYILYGAFSL